MSVQLGGKIPVVILEMVSSVPSIMETIAKLMLAFVESSNTVRVKSKKKRSKGCHSYCVLDN